MQTSFQNLKKSYNSQQFASYEQRIALLKSLKKMLLENEQSIIDSISQDFSYREVFETQIVEISPSLKALSHTQSHLYDWMQPEKRKVNWLFKPARASVMFQPLGVVGIIVPWNYPLYLAMGPLIAALAAGNRVMLKMSEFTPQFSQLFSDLCQKYLPSDWVQVVTGDEKVAAQFSSFPFDHLLFTGATHIGKKVMAAASQNLTPVTLELGGKSPTIIDRDYPLGKAVERILFGKLLNAGQTCLAPDYLWVHHSDFENVIKIFKAKAQQFYPNGIEKDFTALANEKQFQRYKGLLENAQKKGAKIIPLFSGSEVQISDETSSEVQSRKVAPVLVTNVNDDMDVMQQEIFAPILPVLPYQSIEQVINTINSKSRPLALYLFSSNKKIIEQVMMQTVSGGVTLNDTILHVSQETLPFGGVGDSGMGHYHGAEGFKTFSKAKSIFKQSSIASSKLIYPPYGKIASWIYRLMKKS